MKQCKAKGCYSYALNDFPESGFCDKCYWKDKVTKIKEAIDSDYSDCWKMVKIEEIIKELR